jgi:ribosomal-protein-alanine N-acetyltransferase
VVEKLGIREEGVALRFLEIDGVWEDHVRYGITAEEWAEREAELVAEWLAD